MMVTTNLQLIKVILLSTILYGVISPGRLKTVSLQSFTDYTLQLMPQCRSHPTLTELQSVLDKNWSSHVLLRTPLLYAGGSSALYTAHLTSKRRLQEEVVLGQETLKGYFHLHWCQRITLVMSHY